MGLGARTHDDVPPARRTTRAGSARRGSLRGPRDNEEAFRFAEATRDALARAERARSANAAVHERRIEEAKKKTSSKKKNAFDVASFAREQDGEDGEASERDGAPPSSAEGGVAASISEKNDDRGTAENATATTAHVSLATVSAPPLFVANLSEGGTLGDGTQAADDDSGALLRGFIGTREILARAAAFVIFFYLHKERVSASSFGTFFGFGFGVRFGFFPFPPFTNREVSVSSPAFLAAPPRARATLMSVPSARGGGDGADERAGRVEALREGVARRHR